MKKEDFVKLGIPEDIAEQAEAEVQAAILAQQRAHDEEIRTIRVNAAVDAALISAKAKNPRAVRALLELEDAELTETGEIAGLAEQIARLKGAEDSRFLFNSDDTAPRMKGAIPAESGVEDADRRVDITNMSYEELAAFLEANPEFEGE